MQLNRWIVTTLAATLLRGAGIAQETAPADLPPADLPPAEMQAPDMPAAEVQAPEMPAAEAADALVVDPVAPEPAPILEWRPVPVSRLPEWRAWLAGHLELGLRGDRFSLRTRTRERINADGDREGFVGTINELEEQQDLAPFKPVIAWMPLSWVGLELAWHSLTARTRSFSPDPTDGDFVLKGPTLQLILRYPNATVFTPYGGLGWAFYSVDFDHAAWWHHGYSSYVEWLAQGQPDTSRNGLQRRFDTDSNTRGVMLTAGCLANVTEHWAVDFHVRSVRADADSHYTLWVGDQLIDDRGTTTFPFDHYAFSLGVRYQF
jgi:opacity protein-like surface antigen